MPSTYSCVLAEGSSCIDVRKAVLEAHGGDRLCSFLVLSSHPGCLEPTFRSLDC